MRVSEASLSISSPESLHNHVLLSRESVSQIRTLDPIAPLAQRRRRGMQERLHALAVHALAKKMPALVPSRWAAERAEFSTDLREWVARGPKGEDRAAAAKLIENALRYSRSTLDLSGLELTEVPPCLDRLSMLKTLMLNDNKLSELPLNIGNLQRLNRLEVRNNLLTELPSERIADIDYVDVTGNRLPHMSDLENFGGRTRRRPVSSIIIR